METPESTTTGEPVFEVENLRVWYYGQKEPVKAVDGVSFALEGGERFGLAGESGSGKSTIVMATMGLIQPPGRIEGGSIRLAGHDLTRLSGEAMRRQRLAQVALVPQGAMNSLNPVRRIRDHFVDNIRAHEGRVGADEIRRRMVRLLRLVGLSDDVGRRYPHELSGGMKQRVCIALAITQRPQLIVADEPTSALDVVVQRQVVQTLRRVQDELDAAVILVGHDMGVLAQFVQRLGVMYAGRLVEVGSVEDVFADPLHPYTRMLISSIPTIEERPAAGDSLTRTTITWDRAVSANAQLVEVRPGHWAVPVEGEVAS